MLGKHSNRDISIVKGGVVERDASHPGSPAHMHSGEFDPRERLLQITTTDVVIEVCA
jgi:hypothetical protein